jgi:hypothetical protein
VQTLHRTARCVAHWWPDVVWWGERGGIATKHPLGTCVHAIGLRITRHADSRVLARSCEIPASWTFKTSPPPELSGSIGHLLWRNSRPQLAGLLPYAFF